MNDETCITIDASDGSFGEIWIAPNGSILRTEAPFGSGAERLVRRIEGCDSLAQAAGEALDALRSRSSEAQLAASWRLQLALARAS